MYRKNGIKRQWRNDSTVVPVTLLQLSFLQLMMRTPRETDSIAHYKRISNEAIRTSCSEVKSGNSIPLILKRIDVSICARDCAV